MFALAQRIGAPRKRLLVIVMMAMFGASGPAHAAVLNSRPVSPLGDNDLQNLFANTSSDAPPGIYIAGPIIDVVADQSRQAIFTSTASGGSIASFVIELTASLNTNRLGIYDFADPTKKVELFDGTAGVGSLTLVSFLDDGRVLVFFVDSGVTDFSGEFGFYVDVHEAPVGGGGDGNPSTFDYAVWGEDDRNPGGAAQALTYQGNDLTTLEIAPFAPGLFTSDTWIIAFEDALVGGPEGGSSDEDYSDLVILVDSIVPVEGDGGPGPSVGAVPTVSQWGLVIMALLLLVGAKVYFRRPTSARISIPS